MLWWTQPCKRFNAAQHGIISDSGTCGASPFEALSQAEKLFPDSAILTSCFANPKTALLETEVSVRKCDFDLNDTNWDNY